MIINTKYLGGYMVRKHLIGYVTCHALRIITPYEMPMVGKVIEWAPKIV